MYLAYLMWLLLASRSIQSSNCGTHTPLLHSLVPNHTHITSVETVAMMASEFHVEENSL